MVFESQRSTRILRHNCLKAAKPTLARTHVDDDVERVVVGQKDANTAAVLHGFVVVEVQFVHLRVAGTGQAPLPATGAPGPLMSRLLGRRQHQCFFSPSAAPKKRNGRTDRLSRPSSAVRTGHGDLSCSQPLWRHR